MLAPPVSLNYGPSVRGFRIPDRGPALLWIQAIVVMAVLAVALGTELLDPDPARVLMPACAVTLLIGVWNLASWRLTNGTVFDPYGLFVLAALPFHLGYPLLNLLGQADMMQLTPDFTTGELVSTLGLIAASFSLLHFGALAMHAVASRRTVERAPAVSGQSLRFIGWLLLLVSFIPLAIDLREDVLLVAAGGYRELFRLTEAAPTAVGTLIGLLGSYYIPGVMFLAAGARDRPIEKVFSLIALLSYTAVHLFLGFRAYALIPVVVYAWVWHTCVKPLRLGPLAFVGLTMFLVIATLVRRVRDLAGAARFDLSSLWQAYTSVDNPVLALVAELGESMFTVSYTTRLVPLIRPFEWGTGYLRTLLNAVPIVQATDPHGYNGIWLAWEVRPLWAAGGFGFGYSFIAEAYLNFGWILGPLSLAVLGAAIVWATQWAIQSGDPARVAFIAGFLPLFLFFVRGESITLSRPILWYSLLPFLAVLFLRHLSQRAAPVRS